MTRDELINKYFTWLCSLIHDKHQPKSISYEKLLERLHSIDFVYSSPRDQNRAQDGLDLRYRFAIEHDLENVVDRVLRQLNGCCSVLEMMVALALRCEETIMDDPRIGNRTGQWFWGMVTNLGLGSMRNDRFDRDVVDQAIFRFLNRDYEPDGKGGLFTVRDCDRDLRTVEIWYQLCWYLNSIT